MASIPLRTGDFVWTRFPYESEPDLPGPIRHAACVIGAFNQSQAAVITPARVDDRGLVVGVYTSSQVTKFGRALPIGIIQVSPERATTTGGQTAFFIDVRKRAFLPYTRAFFPDIDSIGHGIIGRANKRLLNEIIEKYALVNDRHRDLVVNVGPLRP